jgi:RNA polymerase sigma factor (sigma-70 family)
MLTGLDQWFATEILPHERLLLRYLLRVWRNSSDVPDLLQEVYVRVYESARTQLPRQPKPFLFATARNLMADQIRRRRIVSIDTAGRDTEYLNAMVDEISPERQLNAGQELHRLAVAFDSLTDRCREVIWFRRVEGLSQRETAERLGLKEEAIESQLARGMRALTRAIFDAAADDPGAPKFPKERRSHDSEG